MNLYHLRYFVTLAHMEHYTRAADLLAITQPSLSHAISSLESELGVKLFKKNGRNVTLTKYGKSFLTDAEDVLQKLDASVGSLQLAGKGEGHIDIAFLRTLGSDFVPRILRRFLDENQGKQIDFALHCDKVITNEILKGIKEQKYDIGFCSKINDEPLIEFIPVAKQDLVVIVPPDHPFASKSEIHLEETLEYKQIIYKSGSGLRHIIDHLFDQIGAYPDVSYEIVQYKDTVGCVSDLLAGRVDVVVNDLLNQKILSQEYEGAKIVCDPFTHAENAIAVQKGKDDLLAFINECIDEYYADGTYDTLWTKWIDASGEGEEAAAAEDAETAE